MLSIDQLFQLVTLTAVIGWVILVFLPFWRLGQWIAAGIIPSLLGATYVIFLGMSIMRAGGFDIESFSTLDNVTALFSQKEGMLIGWIHYLAFDLFIGTWEARDAKRVGIHHLFLIPCLALTFMFGPAGLLLYFLVRTVRAGRILPLD